MKYKFNESFLGLGYIKELLKEFNLPSLPVAVDGMKFYKDQLYIKDLSIYKFVKKDNDPIGRLVKATDYYFNRPILNLTTNMSLTTSFYSTDLHEYLGNYLRFMKDYKKLNLMSIYNCFSNRAIYPGNYDENYNYYAVPVRFGEVYTIGIDSSIPITMWCTFWDNSRIKDRKDSSSSGVQGLEMNGSSPLVEGEFLKDTIMIEPSCSFNKPFVYTKLKDYDAEQFWHQRKNLKLIIKVPTWNKTSITVLEGDYIFNDSINNLLTTNFNHGIEGDFDRSFIKIKDVEYENRAKEYMINYPTKLSLLSVNDNEKHPFADRLIEYLLNIAVDKTDPLDDNIKRTQMALYLLERTPIKIYGDWDSRLNEIIFKLENNSHTNLSGGIDTKYINSKSNFIVKTKIGKNDKVNLGVNDYNLIDSVYDLLTYVDKDVEALFKAARVADGYIR